MMLMNRRTFIAKRGCLQEAAALLKKEVAKVNSLKGVHIYVSNIGPFDTIATEFEVKDLVEYQEVLKEWGEVATPEFWEKWYSLTETGGSNEIWTVVE